MRNRSHDERPVLGMVAALRREVAPLLHRSQRVERLSRALYRFSLRDEPVVLVVAGIGQENSFRAASELAARFRLHTLWSLGFAGGLTKDAETGALILADEIIDEATGTCHRCCSELPLAVSGCRGRLLSVREVISDTQQKRVLGGRWQAAAVDMEAAGVARAATAANLPFGALKTISDPLEQSMAIDFRRCRSDDGGLSTWRIVREGIASPQGLRDLWRLAGNSRLAASRLALALG